MKEIKRTIHLQDVSDQQTLDVEKLSKVIGGSGAYGCTHDVCESNYKEGAKGCTIDICASTACTTGMEGFTCNYSYDWEHNSGWPSSEGPQ